MRYVSTRGQTEAMGFEAVLLEGLARDGGLFVPEHWPKWEASDFAALPGLSYAEVAVRVIQAFVGDDLDEQSLGRIVCEAYTTFAHQQVAPLVQLGSSHWLMELYHGPTLAFKDVAMQVLARFYDHALSKTDRRITIVGATSGDTGGAAIEAFQHSTRADIFIMHPHGRTSEVQRRQMTSVDSPNVHNIAIEGTFDDCQDLLKAMFNDSAFRDEVRLSGVNSINWARVLPQVVYYITSAVALGAPDRPVAFSVPTGNFGDIYAGYVASQMGLPIDRLIIASNTNDILTRALTTGDHSLGEVTPTMSPSMDIQVSSNFERLLFDLLGRDSAAVRDMMQQLKSERRFTLAPDVLAKARELFSAYRCNEQTTLQTMAKTHHESAITIDPHTAVGVHATQQALRDEVIDRSTPVVTLATAHPAKFPDAVENGVGKRPPLPDHLADLYEREERYTPLPAELGTVQQWVKDQL